jgi:ubiquinone/menaquinone biosynthesis C-methylase UbiE
MNMPTDFKKISHYYDHFDEWNRLESGDGAQEYKNTCELLLKALSAGCRVLDLGGGPGRYTLFLAERGFRVTLADLSGKNIEEAKERAKKCARQDMLEGMVVANAVDLSAWPDHTFNAVVAMGPFYHLTAQDERQSCLLEINRVLNPGGLAFVAFMARDTGVMHLLERRALKPEQVDQQTIETARRTGVFNNLSKDGFQEGYYPDETSFREEILAAGFEPIGLPIKVDDGGHEVLTIKKL